MGSERNRLGLLGRLGRAAGLVLTVAALVSCGSTSGDGPQAGRTGDGRQGMGIRRPVMADVGLGGSGVADDGQQRGVAPRNGEEREPGPTGPPAAIVPEVEGMRFARAVHGLWRSGIDYGLVFARESPGGLWSVIQEDPPPGADTPRSGEVNLVIALPHMHGAGVNGTVRCKPEADELEDPYCLGKLFKY
jgi:hypothetical protein